MIQHSTPKIVANPPGEGIHLTREQLWQAMLWKARYPTLFVAPITAAEVLEEYSDGLLREIIHSDSKGTEVIQERIFFAPMELVTFLRLTGKVHGQILNHIETDEAGQLTLRFSFTLSMPDATHGSPEEEAYRVEFADGYVRAVNATLAATREWVRTGVDPTEEIQRDRDLARESSAAR